MRHRSIVEEDFETSGAEGSCPAAKWEPLFADCQRAERFGGEPTLGLGCDNHRESCGLITKPDSLRGLGPALRDAGVSLK